MELIVAWYGVNNLNEAKKFYGETLGLKKVFEMTGWAEYAHAPGAAAIGLAEHPAANGNPGGATVVLRVDNLDRARNDLTARGVKFDGEIEEVPGIVRLATFRDPSGNRLQLAQTLVAAKS
ncbi:MAG TPA: VOC family protein [Candidatus Acidoferrales bacterium]